MILLNEKILQAETHENPYAQNRRISYGNMAPSERLSSPYSKERLQIADSLLSQKIKNQIDLIDK